ncbi:hypothetical protein DTW90_30660 [Neorhizobium sp. P12A]|uniref:hypothetical protein n=1 Tax=Neorhizobium sp. P12A TaxID=2268027 RepID=UPI0011EBB3ED|nr:hypothetical protein [Neorhizobium sp. P12A]KAA0689856.1 hypothetical protein DTW90_30660 [Neorhizobium sp. P12A]
MSQEVNGARGEVALRAGGQDLVIAATMKGLSAVSTQLQCKSLADLFVRLTGTEVAATEAAIAHLTVRGDAVAALAKLKLKDFKACSEAFAAALAHHFDGDEGNAEAADQAAK